jgi:hypothetical protein
MVRAFPHLRLVLFAGVLAVAPGFSAGSAAAPQAASGSLTPEPICIPWFLCHPMEPATLQLSGAAAADSGGEGPIEVRAWRWGKVPIEPAGVATSDPQEGGEVTGGIATSDPQEGGEVTGGIATSDPQEGGEVVKDVTEVAPATTSARRGGKAKVSIGEIAVVKQSDSSTSKLAVRPLGVRTPGRLEQPDVKGWIAPPPSGAVTIVVARGACASGKHFPAVMLTTRSRAYTLKDVEVLACTPTADGTDTCTLSYASLG